VTTVARHFVRLGARTAHCRIAGSGPALLLLHQSPQNSRMWLDLIERYAPRLTVIAPDTPGFGDSDPLADAQPGIADLAAATLELADALGLERFAVFGMHTGGLIGMQLAWAAPRRVAALIVDGFALFDAEERAAMDARYLPPFVPSWDGAHLRWLWCRMREQLFYFPWYDGRAGSALQLDPPTARSTHAAAMDILEVGDGYRQGYGAALRYGERHRVAELKVPSWLLYRIEDVLAAHRERLPLLPPHVATELISGGLPALHARMDSILEQTLTGEAGAHLLLAQPADNDFRRRAVSTAIGTLAIWHAPGKDTAVLRLHAPGSKPPRPDPSAARDGAHLLLLDLPGHGGSGAIVGAHDAGAIAAAIVQAIDQLVPGLPLRTTRWPSPKVHRGAGAACTCVHHGCSLQRKSIACWTGCRIRPSCAAAHTCWMPSSGSASATCCGRGCRRRRLRGGWAMRPIHARYTTTRSSCCVWAHSCAAYSLAHWTPHWRNDCWHLVYR